METRQVAGHAVEVIGTFKPTYVLRLKEWGEGLFQAAQAQDAQGELLAIIEEPAERTDDNDLWDAGEEERFQHVLREVLRGLEYGDSEPVLIRFWLEGERREIAF